MSVSLRVFLMVAMPLKCRSPLLQDDYNKYKTIHIQIRKMSKKEIGNRANGAGTCIKGICCALRQVDNGGETSLLHKLENSYEAQRQLVRTQNHQKHFSCRWMYMRSERRSESRREHQ